MRIPLRIRLSREGIPRPRDALAYEENAGSIEQRDETGHLIIRVMDGPTESEPESEPEILQVWDYGAFEDADLANAGKPAPATLYVEWIEAPLRTHKANERQRQTRCRGCYSRAIYRCSRGSLEDPQRWRCLRPAKSAHVGCQKTRPNYRSRVTGRPPTIWRSRKVDLANGVTTIPRQRRPCVKPSHLVQPIRSQRHLRDRFALSTVPNVVHYILSQRQLLSNQQTSTIMSRSQGISLDSFAVEGDSEGDHLLVRVVIIDADDTLSLPARELWAKRVAGSGEVVYTMYSANSAYDQNEESSISRRAG